MMVARHALRKSARMKPPTNSRITLIFAWGGLRIKQPPVPSDSRLAVSNVF
jgi:hypothetical protein